MPRRMSFAMTINQVMARQKTVTRRFGWWFLKPGDLLQPVEKAMGLKKGEKMVKIGGLIRISSTRKEHLHEITQEECQKEGFPQITPEQFVQLFCKHHKCSSSEEINRIEFEYL